MPHLRCWQDMAPSLQRHKLHQFEPTPAPCHPLGTGVDTFCSLTSVHPASTGNGAGVAAASIGACVTDARPCPFVRL